MPASEDSCNTQPQQHAVLPRRAQSTPCSIPAGRLWQGAEEEGAEMLNDPPGILLKEALIFVFF